MLPFWFRMPARTRKPYEYVREAAADARDVLLHRRQPLTPPRRLHWYVGGKFESIGDLYLGLLIEEGGLKPDNTVLDIGSGIGRMAVPLTGYVSEEGAYEGFDVVARGVLWCRRHITRAFPNFRFQVADIYNRRYNPRGRHDASSYRFPYPDATFDLAFATSVYTHMLPRDARHYLQETFRVLKPGGTSFSTFFLLDDATRAAMSAGKAWLVFRFQGEGYHTVSREVPEEAVAYEVDRVRTMYQQVGFVIHEPIMFGLWRGEGARSGQDVVIAKRPANG